MKVEKPDRSWAPVRGQVIKNSSSFKVYVTIVKIEVEREVNHQVFVLLPNCEKRIFAEADEKMVVMHFTDCMEKKVGKSSKCELETGSEKEEIEYTITVSSPTAAPEISRTTIVRQWGTPIPAECNCEHRPPEVEKKPCCCCIIS